MSTGRESTGNGHKPCTRVVCTELQSVQVCGRGVHKGEGIKGFIPAKILPKFGFTTDAEYADNITVL